MTNITGISRSYKRIQGRIKKANILEIGKGKNDKM